MSLAHVQPVPPPAWRTWWLAARPKTLSAAFAPVCVGSACAAAVGAFRPVPAAVTLLAAALIQIGTNFANDVFDYEKGADDIDRLGPTRAVQAGWVSPRAMRGAMIAAFALATFCGLYLTWVAGPAIVVVGLASILAGIAYTGGPYPLGYNGLGDVFVFVFFGLIAVVGTTYVQTLSTPALAWWASVPVGALATAILVVNNIRDRDGDRVAGKRTLAVCWGRRGAFNEYLALLALSYAAPTMLVVTGRASAWVLCPLATLPLAVRLVRRVSVDEGPALNRALEGTAKLQLAYSVLLAVGLVLQP